MVSFSKNCSYRSLARKRNDGFGCVIFVLRLPRWADKWMQHQNPKNKRKPTEWTKEINALSLSFSCWLSWISHLSKLNGMKGGGGGGLGMRSTYVEDWEPAARKACCVRFPFSFSSNEMLMPIFNAAVAALQLLNKMKKAQKWVSEGKSSLDISDFAWRQTKTKSSHLGSSLCH